MFDGYQEDFFDEEGYYSPNDYYGYGRNTKDIINQNFDAAISAVVQKVRSTFKQQDSQIP